MPKYNDITGVKMGLLTCVRRHDTAKGKWIFKCDCGTFDAYYPSQARSKGSCGCLTKSKKDLIKRKIKHGCSGTNLYKVWAAMIYRCTRPSTTYYERYGGRGIKVCERWLRSFENFRDDMGSRPVGATIERKDNNGNYEPGNCVWASRKEQACNKECVKTLVINGVKKPISVWCEEIGLKRTTFWGRVGRGRTLEEALKMPLKKQNRNKRSKILCQTSTT